MRLSARPAVKAVNRPISVPNTVRTVLRPDPSIARKIQNANAPISRGGKRVRENVKVATIHSQVKHQRVVATKRPTLKTNTISAARKAIRKPPRVSYISAEMTDAARKELAKYKGTGKGKILIIIGNGPSILEADLKKLVGIDSIDIISINKPDQRVWPTKYWLFCDHTQYKRHKELWDTYKGIIINTTAFNQRRKNTIQIKNLGGQGFSRDLMKGFYLGRSSCYAAMQVGLWMEYDHIYLFGVDMCAVKINGKEVVHYYGVNPDVQPANRISRFDHEARHYSYAADSLPADDRKKFTFCSSYLSYDFAKRFNKMDHKVAVGKILERSQNNTQ